MAAAPDQGLRSLIELPTSTTEQVRALYRGLRDALSGAGPAVRPVPFDPGPDRPLAYADDDPVDPTSVAISSSGSTGAAKTVLLSASALLASAAATHDRLGGPARWLLALPAHHVAGVQVLVRSLVARTTPALLDPQASFTAEAFTAAAALLPDGVRRYTALVPTQLIRLLDDGAATRALAGFDAVLLGGAATAPELLARARAAGVRAVTTYGMSETSGGCVYDGRPLDGVTVRAPAGRVLLAGPTLARGYLGDPGTTARAFAVDPDGVRWFRTDDAGTLDAGRLAVHGRLDDMVISGGVNVAPAAVERVLHGVPGVREAVVVGVPDPQWGQRVAAAVVPEPAGSGAASGPGADELRGRVRAAVAAELGAPAVPRAIVLLESLPLRGPGKPDRAAIIALFTEES